MEAAMNELGPQARAILEAGRDGDDPTAADRARIRASVARAIAGGGASLAAEAALPAKASGALAGGWKVFLTVVAIGAVGAVATTRFGSPPGSTDLPAVTTASAAELQAAPPQAPAPPLTPATSPAPAPPPAEPTALPSAAPAAVRPPIAAPRPPQPILAAQDPASPAEVPLPASPPPAPVVAATPSPATAPSAAADTLMEETRRLREARAALKGGDAARALSLLDERGAAGAQLREERAAARILALCDLGRVADARALGARFLAESPRSPLADRVRASCAGH
jgi:hypothetical protein